MNNSVQTIINVTNGSVYSQLLSGLRPGTLYEVTIVARNSAGNSDKSQPLQQTTNNDGEILLLGIFDPPLSAICISSLSVRKLLFNFFDLGKNLNGGIIIGGIIGGVILLVIVIVALNALLIVFGITNRIKTKRRVEQRLPTVHYKPK